MRSVTFQRGVMQVCVRPVTMDRLQVTYERAPHDMIRVECSFSTALLLVEQLLERDTLREVRVPSELL